jgi:hypothetical protein
VSEHADELLRRGTGLLRMMNSCGSSSANCPSTAEAVYHFLNTGRLRPAVCAGPGQGFETFGTYQRGTIQHVTQRVRQGGHGTHAVVEAGRNPSHSLGPMHSFNLVNVRGTVYVADAQTARLTSDVRDYVSTNAFRPQCQYVFDGYRTRLVTV